MKRLSSLLVCLVIITSSLVGCSSPAKITEDSAVTVTSSALSTYGSWLENRLEADGLTSTAEIIIGDTSTAEEYGVDMSGFVYADGYIIRRASADEPVLIFGTNAESVDTAVRYYANYCDKSSALNVVEGESYRVGTITISGHDLSEFVIVCPDDADQSQRFAATELQKYLGNACGVYPEIVTASNGPSISLVCDKTGEIYGDESFCIKSDANGVTITGGRYRGCMYGVYAFLEDYIGYTFYYKNQTTDNGLNDNAVAYLYKADTVTVPADIDQTEFPSITVRDTYAWPYLLTSPALNYNGQKYDGWSIYGGYGRIVKACHGHETYINDSELYDMGYEVGYNYGVNPCFTDEDLTDLLIERVIDDLQRRKNSGAVMGKDFTTVDISQRDISSFCMCNSCVEVYRDTGAVSGAVVTLANKVAEAIEPDFPEITVAILAYYGTATPPENITIHKNVQVSYCFYISDKGSIFICGQHSINGTECSTNKHFSDNFEGWQTLTDNIYVWYYPSICYYNGYSSTYTNNIYHDIKYLAEKDVYGIFFLTGPNTESALFANWYMGQRMMWDATISEEEYHELLKEFLFLSYGDGYEFIYDYIQIMESAADATNNCFCGFHSKFWDKISMTYLKPRFDLIFTLKESAIRLARNSTQEALCRELFGTAHYFEIAVMHHDMWEVGDDASREAYKEKVNYFITNYGNSLYLSDDGPIAPPLNEVDYDVNPFDWHPLKRDDVPPAHDY